MRLDPKIVQALSLFVPKKDARQYLENIYFEMQLDRTILVATDGCAILVVCVEGTNEREGNFKIPPAVFPKSKLDYGVLLGDDGKVKVTEGFMEVEVPQDGNRYPDFRRVVPNKTELLEHRMYDPDLLLRFKKASKLLGGSIVPFVHPNNVVDIALPNVFGVIMPFSVPNDGRFTNDTSPIWMNENKD